MKSIRLFIYLSVAGVLFAGCKKDYTAASIAVDAGTFQYVQLPTDSADLTGTIISGQSYATNYSWTQIAGPTPAQITANTSLTTTVKSLSIGTYIFQFKATNSAGTIIGLDTTGVEIVSSGSNILTLQPDSAHAIETIAYSYTPNAPSAPANPVTTMPVWTWTVNSVPVFTRAFIKFDLSSIPPNATIISARLSLYSLTQPEWDSTGGDSLFPPQYGTYNACVIKRITSNWSTSTLDWNNMPTDTTTDEAVIPTISGGTGNATDMPITSLVQDIESTNNYGFVIGLIYEVYYNQRQFASAMCPDPTRRPKLVIVYQ